ncbi:MAG: rhodanese-like domain-containing protein [Maritimibacter sp.]|nr:rhodanese-like domain-containing protein [Maritimibacter sp.]
MTRKDLPEAREVCPTTSQRLLGEGALLVDTREPADVARTGFAGCEVLTIPLSAFEDRWAEVPRDRDVILADAAPERSLKATYFLMYQGYERAMNMQHGLARWVARGFPITGSDEGVESAAAASSCCADPAPAEPNAGCGGGATSCC